MYKLLSGLSVIEASSFVASPTAGLYCAQMGADVIRVDQIGGGQDFKTDDFGESFVEQTISEWLPRLVIFMHADGEVSARSVPLPARHAERILF